MIRDACTETKAGRSPEHGTRSTGHGMEEQWVWVPFEVEKKYDGLRVDQFLSRRLLGYSRTKVQKILDHARVLKGDRVVRANTKVHTMDKIQVAYLRRPEAPLAAGASLPVLFEDDDLIVVNKPGDLLSHPTDKIVNHTVLGILRQSRPDLSAGCPGLPNLHLLHRLDRETSGVIALAKNVRSARAWTRHMQARRVRKEYVAIVRGHVSPAHGTIDFPIGRQAGGIRVRQWVNVPGAVSAITKYRLDSVFCWQQKNQRGASFAASKRSVVRVFPLTGRLHQIRVHFAAIGHPLLGDPLYTGEGEIYQKMIKGTCTAADRVSLGFPRVALHAAVLTFPHPTTSKELRVEAALPADMEILISGKLIPPLSGRVTTYASEKGECP